MGINYSVVQDNILHANRMNNKKTELRCKQNMNFKKTEISLIWKFIKHEKGFCSWYGGRNALFISLDVTHQNMFP